MAGMSFLHSGHDAHTGNHGSTGEAIASIKLLQHTAGARGNHTHHGPAHGPKHAGGKAGRGVKSTRIRPWWVISPLDIFAYCMGAGAAGELLKKLLPANAVIVVAVACALAFNFGVIKPLLGWFMRFATRESEGLEGQVAQTAEAVTRFDDAGRGLVRMTLDGQIVQLLAILDSDELARGVRVAKGDGVLVVGVDAARNTCRVTRELAS